MSNSELVAQCSAPPSTNITGCALQGETVTYPSQRDPAPPPFERTVLILYYSVTDEPNAVLNCGPISTR